MAALQGRGVMTFNTGDSFTHDMLTMLAGIIVVVLVRSTTRTSFMAFSAISANINGACQPVRRGLAAVAPGAGAGAAVATGRAALGVKVGQDVDVNSAIIMCSPIMAGTTAGCH